jgi:hypothetical protein
LFITNAAITDPIQQSAINGLVTSLKGYGIWSKMKALYPFVGGTASQHKYNLRNPLDTDAAFRLVFNGGWVHSSTGALPNGTNAFADSYFIPNANTALNSFAMSMYSRTNTTGLFVDLGGNGAAGTGITYVFNYHNDQQFSVINSGVSYTTNANTNSLGLFSYSRTAATIVKNYKNGVLKATGVIASTSNNLGKLYVGATNGNGTATFYSNRSLGFAHMGDGLTDAETTNLYTAVQTFQTKLLRQVGVPIVSDSDAQAFLNAAVIENVTQANAVNTLVTDLKGYGIWSKMKALYPFVGGTASQHKFNLKNPLDTDAAFRLTFNGGWTHSSTGAKPNGTNAYANSFFNPSLHNIANSSHLSYYSRTTYVDAVGVAEMGCFTAGGAQRNAIFASINGTSYCVPNNNNEFIVSFVSTGVGFYVASRTSATAIMGQRNSTQYTNTATTARINNIISLGASSGPTAGSYGSYSPRESAFASIGDGLSATEAANYYTAVQAFQVSLNRQVGVPIVSDSDAQAFLNAAVITNTTQATAVNTLVTDLKGYGIWTKMKALYPFVGGTASSHKFNLKNPLDTDAAYRLTFNGGITHASTGVKGNGTNSYYQTFLNPSTVFSPASGGSQFIYNRNNTDIGNDIGSFQSTVNYRMFITVRSSSTLYAGSLSNAYYQQTITDSRGFFGVTREPNAPNFYSILNTTSFSTTDAYQEPNSPIVGLAFNIDNGNITAYCDREQAMACIADGLTVAEAQNLRLANLAFQTTLSRNV